MSGMTTCLTCNGYGGISVEEADRLSAVGDEIDDLKSKIVELRETIRELLEAAGVERPKHVKDRSKWLPSYEEATEAIEKIKDYRADADSHKEWTDALDKHGITELAQLKHYDADARDFFEALGANLEMRPAWARPEPEPPDPLMAFKVYLERSGILPNATTYSPTLLADTLANIITL